MATGDAIWCDACGLCQPIGCTAELPTGWLRLSTYCGDANAIAQDGVPGDTMVMFVEVCGPCAAKVVISLRDLAPRAGWSLPRKER